MRIARILFLFPLFIFAREYVAIIDFEGINVSDGEAKALTQRLITEMIKLGEYTVLERSDMKKVLDEQKFQYSGCVDINCAVEIGKMLGAKYMVVGSVSKIGNTFSVDARLINVKTAESYGSADFSHTGEIDYLLLEGMKTIAYKLCGVEYHPKPPAPVKTTVDAGQGEVNRTGQGNTAGATLTISSNPAGAFVYINDNYMGSTPLEMANYPPGEYTVKVKMENFREESETIQLVPFGKKEIEFILICQYNYDCKGICAGIARKDQCGVCAGDNSSCTDDCGIINGANKDKDCDGVCFGKNNEKEFCYDANDDGDGDIYTKKILCPQDAEPGWVNECVRLTGDVLLSLNLNNVNSITINHQGIINDQHPISLITGKHKINISTTYLFKQIKIEKNFQITEDELTTVFVSEKDIQKEMIAHRKNLLYSSGAAFLLWLGWGLLPYDM